ncbi:phage antirepressor N-terminal domain-containing protein [Proteiniphilum sp.]|uniref:phage antirepressor N-terminal domain-containing protein n=1 Tax=Proteiniphilum sp. TaxID=1926877 RepID=UPI003333162F
MEQKFTNFIDFNGKSILFARINGKYWISIKSVCEALNVNYNRQFQNIQGDPILGPAFANQQIQVPNDQARNMACLPEYLVYGWIFSIKSNSPELIEYKKECYDVLFNHFHGVITRKAEMYSELAKAKKKLSELEATLNNMPEYAEFTETRMRYARLWKNIKDTSDMQDMFLGEDM